MKILLGMSGGIDSTMSAKLLMDIGYEVEGALLLMHEYSELEAARLASKELGIKLNVIDATEAFNNIIKKYFAAEYASARTPNPCILCNEKVKFRVLCDYAEKNGFDRIATGHYAKLVTLSDEYGVRHAVSEAKDTKKDQSYMLYRLPEDILSKLVFPLSDIGKEEVRGLAENIGISTASKKDSQDICFLPNGGHIEYIESVLGSFPEGDFIDEKGNTLGRHKGVIRYTVGQRKGLGIALGERAFVTEIDPVKNTVTLSPSFKGREQTAITDIVFSGLPVKAAGEETDAFVKVRYCAPKVSARITFENDGYASVRFSTPVNCAPGQSLVAYSADGTVLFGGFIK